MGMAYEFSADQASALKAIGTWYRGQTAPYLTLGGYAGTGKTTLLAYLRKALNSHDDELKVAFCAYTGKAARVLADTLRSHHVARRRDTVSTIHSLIYTAVEVPGGGIAWERKDSLDCGLIIVDEASMVDEPIWRDLLSFGVPILAVGDHGQLPPIGSSFNLMANPNLRLERVFRQVEASPIIEVATLARTSGIIPVRDYGGGVRKLDRSESETGQLVDELLESWKPELLVLCGYNRTRVNLNQAIRAAQGFEFPPPSGGDRVVCLRNDRFHKLYNGMTGTIQTIYPAEDDPDGRWYWAEIDLDGEDRQFVGHVLREQFGSLESQKDVPKAPDGTTGALFDFGYALTVHKAQGSQAERVLLFEERFPKMTDDDWRRWLYTAVTRAQHELTIVGG